MITESRNKKKHALYVACCRPITFCMSSTLGIWTRKSSVPTLWLAPPSSFWECSSTWTRTGGYECLDHRRTKNRKILKGRPLFPILKFSDLKPDPIFTLHCSSGGRYKIPYGGMFDYVSSANYFGEIVEWWGYAIAARFTPAALLFAGFTTMFLVLSTV